MFAHAVKFKPVLILTVFTALVVGLSLTGCEKKINIIEPEPESQSYVGSLACQACHPDLYAEFSKTGHNFKLNPASLASQPGYYPYGDLPGPPPGYVWDDASYVIGGFWWKARFINKQGYIITGDQVQYNLATDRWVAYEATTVNKPYDCGPCHTTGYKYEGHQGGMVGMVGTWALNGIQCERCHGPGGKHVDAPYDVRMIIDRSAAMCGGCHIRGDVSKIPAKDGFIDHHEQYNELHSTKKINFACVDCHNPHISLHRLNPTRASAIKITCGGCHFEEAAAFAGSALPHYGEGVACIECHMAYAVKSAEGDLTTHKGDVRSHLFRININASAEMFTPDGKYANGYLTLQYVCLRCHVDETVDWASQNAPEVHPF